MKQKFKRNTQAEALYRKLELAVDDWKCEPYRRLSLWSFFFRRFYVISRVDMSRRLKHGIRDYATQLIVMDKADDAIEAMRLGTTAMTPKGSIPVLKRDEDKDFKDMPWEEKNKRSVKRMNDIYTKVDRLLLGKAGGDCARMMSMRYMLIGRTCMLLKHRGLVSDGSPLPPNTKDKPSLKQYNDGRSSRKDLLAWLVEHGFETVLVDAAKQIAADKRPKEAKEMHENSMDTRPAPEAVPVVP